MLVVLVIDDVVYSSTLKSKAENAENGKMADSKVHAVSKVKVKSTNFHQFRGKRVYLFT